MIIHMNIYERGGQTYPSIIIFGFTYSGNRDPWNDQEMYRGLWVYISECQTLTKTQHTYVYHTNFKSHASAEQIDLSFASQWNRLTERLVIVLVYLFIFINNVCRDAFVNHFGENGWSWVAILSGSLLCQPHLVTLGAQWSLWFN